MSKYRPGYIEGKARLGVYVDEEVRKSLRIRAAETGENVTLQRGRQGGSWGWPLLRLHKKGDGTHGNRNVVWTY